MERDNMVSDAVEKFMLQLFDVQGIKFGKFKLKSGIESPIYFDLRVIVSYPKLMNDAAKLLWQVAVDKNVKCDCLCGVPYTALPLATVIAVNENVPMLLKRNETKDYGTKKRVEGHFKYHDRCLIIEDAVTTGSSVLETVEILREEGLSITDAVALLDREQGGARNVECAGVKFYSVCGISKLIGILKKNKKISQEIAGSVLEFIKQTQVAEMSPQVKSIDSRPSFLSRQCHTSNEVAKKLFQIMDDKKTNLAVAVDFTSCSKFLEVANAVGPHICILKTHVDIMDDFNNDFISALMTLGQKHNFLIFEDRKFADIGKTVQHQFKNGVYKICEWADIVTAHSLPGSGVVAGLKSVCDDRQRACLLIAEMSSDGNLGSDSYISKTTAMAEDNKDFVIGFISQSKVSDHPGFLHMSPGIKMTAGSDELGQQYVTPEVAIKQRGADIIIVGHAITEHADPQAAAKAFQDASYQAYMSLVKN